MDKQYTINVDDMVENFFSILKCACIYRQKPKNLKQAREMIDEYIWFYNHHRLQQRIRMTPLEMRRTASA